MASTIRMYGLDWPASYPKPMIELTCCKKYRERPFCNASLDHPGEHWLRAIRMLFTPEQLRISRWTSEFAEAWGVEDTLHIWGCAASEKSHLAALGLLSYWCVDPTETLCLFASTTREMLRLRSWSSVVSLFGMLKENSQYIFPGKEARASMAIINELDQDNETGAHSRSVKASLRGVAVNEGSSLRGCHTSYVAVCLDEVNLMRQETWDERINLSIGTKRFRMLTLCNPQSFNDLAGRISVPVDGWASVGCDTVSWRTKGGALVLHRNGYQSPAITEPDGAELYPHLLNQLAVDRILKEEGSDDTIGVWSMIKGYPPPSGTEATVLSETELNAYEAQLTSPWAAGSEPVVVAALDAAFTSPDLGGDGCVLQFASVGRVAPGVPAIVFERPIYLTIAASAKIPVAQQILTQVREKLEERNVPLCRLAVDSSGTQSIADVLDMGIGGSSGNGVLRYNYATKATDTVTFGGREKYSDKYGNIITELYCLTASFVRCRNIRGLPAEAAKYLTMRRFTRRAKNAKLSLESKKEFSQRIGGASPDEADAVAMLCGLVRDRLGFHPGQFPQQFTQQAFSPITTAPMGRRGGIVLKLRASYGALGTPKGYT